MSIMQTLHRLSVTLALNFRSTPINFKPYYQHGDQENIGKDSHSDLNNFRLLIAHPLPTQCSKEKECQCQIINQLQSCLRIII